MAKNTSLNVVVLAAGLGTRMKSRTPKVLHKICERPILWWVLNSVASLSPGKTVVVLGHSIETIKSKVLSWQFAGNFLRADKLKVARQKRQLGSGDALKAAFPFIKKSGYTIVISADVPLIKPDTLRKLFRYHIKSRSFATVLSSKLEKPFGYGRIIRDVKGAFLGITEQKDASIEEQKICEVNSGVYCFSNNVLEEAINKIKPLNKKKEYYLTDVMGILREGGREVLAFAAASCEEILGINDRWELAHAEKIMRLNINEEFAKKGVTFIEPQNSFVSPEAKIGSDTTIYPNVFIKGNTSIGQNCIIGHGCYISDSVIGSDVQIRCSYIYSSTIESGVKIGPFAHIRPHSVLKRNARVGNFSEIKKSTIGRNSKVSHLAYIGDAELQENINVGAGAITCNYDGKNKHRTYVGAGSFIGSNVNLIAPVKIGKNALIGAGSTISKDVPDNTLALERGHAVLKARKNLKR